MSVVTKPIVLDETGQDIVTQLQAIVAGLAPNAGQISYSNATSGLSADDVQEALDEIDGNVDTLSNSLTQLMGNFEFGTPVPIDLSTISSYTATVAGVLSGYFRKTSDTTNKGELGVKSSLLNYAYRYIGDIASSINGGYSSVELLVAKGEVLQFTKSNLNESGSSLYFYPFKNS